MYARHPVVCQLYVACAVLGFAASFVPLYHPRRPGDVYETMTMWSAAVDLGSGVGLVAIGLVLALVGLALAAATPRPRTPALTAAVLVLALVGLLMVLTRVGEGSNPPSLGAGAGLLLGTTLALLATAATDLWTLLGPPSPSRR